MGKRNQRTQTGLEWTGKVSTPWSRYGKSAGRIANAPTWTISCFVAGYASQSRLLFKVPKDVTMLAGRQADVPGQAASCHSPRKKRTWCVDRLRDHNRVSTHCSRVTRGRVMRGIHSGLKSTESCLFQPGLQVQSRARYDGRASLALEQAPLAQRCTPLGTPRSHNWHGIPRLPRHSIPSTDPQPSYR